MYAEPFCRKLLIVIGLLKDSADIHPLQFVETGDARQHLLIRRAVQDPQCHG